MIRSLELLAPAKGLDSACAAVDYGADALYMGGANFGARKGAGNSLEDIARAVEYAHQYGVQLYATLNTLLYDHEVEMAREVAQQLIDVGVDALIIQDMAYLRMGLHSPRGVEFHASTQMCNISAEGVAFLNDLGVKRVVLERNLSLAQIEAIAAANGGLDLEAFVHGAICVGYSGRCYLSRSLSQRSGNRGDCSQPCRLSYDLVDGKGSKVIERRHLLSVQDFNLTEYIGALIDGGVNSFKIEGRLKDIDYTKNVVAHYRRVLDREIEQRDGVARASTGRSLIDFEPNPSKSFTRGESHYLMEGRKRGKVASFDSPKAMGEVVGKVTQCRDRRHIVCRSHVELINGDGISISTRKGLVGASVNGVERVRGGEVLLTLSAAVEVEVGDTIFRNQDRAFQMALSSSRTRRVVAVRGYIYSQSDLVRVKYIDEEGLEVSVSVEQPLEQAETPERMAQVVEMQLSKCGDTIFECVGVDINGWGGEFIPSAILARLRREALAQLREKRIAQNRDREVDGFIENREARYPATTLGSEVGVTNQLAEQFYRDHGVESIERSLELRDDLEGRKVMESNYCIRGEIGECLMDGSKLVEPLYLERGGDRYRLEFDCGACRMALVKEGRDDR